MWIGADPEVEVFIFRHPESIANIENANYGSTTPLSPRGEQQIEHMLARAEELGVEHVFCSTALRAQIPAGELGKRQGLSIQSNPNFDEFRRPAFTIGKKNDDPEVVEVLARRIEEFGPGYRPCDGDMSFAEVIMVIADGFGFLLESARELRRNDSEPRRSKRFMLLTHGLLMRLYGSWIIAKQDSGMFTKLFQNSYDVIGLPNAAMIHIWYGHPYRKPDVSCWNMELGEVSHLPPELR